MKKIIAAISIAVAFTACSEANPEDIFEQVQHEQICKKNPESTECVEKEIKNAI